MGTRVDMPWQGQQELRWSMERLADEALDRAGLELDPRGFIIGLPIGDTDREVLIEPDRHDFDTTKLNATTPLADEHYAGEVDEFRADHPHRDNEHYLAAREEGGRRQAMQAALTAAARFHDRSVCVGISVVVGEYRFFPILAVLSESWDDVAKLGRTTVDGLHVDASFIEAIINDALSAASRELDRHHPTSLLGVDAGAILRSAADSFVNDVAARTGPGVHHGLRDALDAVSAQTYEGRAGVGNIVLARLGHPAVQRAITFEHPIPVSVARSFRKTLEMTGTGLHLLTDGREVYGLGHLDSGYDSEEEACYTIKVAGDGAWELWHTDTPYLRVDHGHPSLPRDRVDADIFDDTLRRLFPNSSGTDSDALWDMTQACIQQAHGTMLVVHPDAALEGERLLSQAYTVEPTRLDRQSLAALTKIDGAVLVSPDAHCHAVGVILDGVATGAGDISRGARYNSAIRYLAGAGRGSMVIIVSEDGRIDVLPHIARRIRRASVQQAVQRLATAAIDGSSFEKFKRLDDRVRALEFYLGPDQCEAVNAAREAVENRRWLEDHVRMQVVPISPHPAMDDSYFADSV